MYPKRSEIECETAVVACSRGRCPCVAVFGHLWFKPQLPARDLTRRPFGRVTSRHATTVDDTSPYDH